MSPKYWLPVCSLLVLALLLPGCGGGTSDPNPPPPSNPAPTVASIAPTSGTTNGGTALTITGTGFLTGATVSLGGTAATSVTRVSSTSITATSPAHAAGAVNVVVTNTDAKSGTMTGGYTYTAPPSNPAPTVTSITPNSGTTNGGTAVTIAGTGFLAGATLKLGGTSATGVTVVNGTTITATTPAHTAGAVSVVVTNTDAKTGTLTNGYTYTAPPTPNPAPTVTAIAPTSGVTTGGTAVTITGTGFLTGATVSLGGTAATGVTVMNATTILATTPAHAAGAVNVVVTNTDAKSGTLANGYTYTAPAGTLALSTVVSGMSNPVGMERTPNANDNRFFIVEQRGTIRILENGALHTGNFLDIQSLNNFDGQEQGLLGLAFHPNYSTNRKFYVNYTRDLGGRETVIAEYQTLASDPDTADPNSERIILTVSQPFTNHKGGQLVFGPDNFLYIGLGDGGSSGDPLNNGQNLTVFLGKMLRIGVDPPFTGGRQYAIPADNPFAGGGGLGEIWAYGLRNPWRFSFERGTTRMFVADVGQGSFEEVDIMQKGGNFGWRVMEAAHCFNPASGCDMSGKILPITEYDHSVGIAVIGGYVYKGTAIASLSNKYIFGDLTGKIWSLTEGPTGTWTRATLLSPPSLMISSFGQDAAGEVYVVDYNGQILKLVLQ